MFKNGKEKSVKSVDDSKVEQDYKRELKSVLKKLEEHQEKIDNIVEIVSARFGEGVNSDDINKKIKEASSNFADKITSISDENNELYNKCMGLIYSNEENINELKNSISEKDVQILEINKQLDEFIEKDEARQKALKEKFNDTNKKIGKINYQGITTKFDKLQKEQNKKMSAKIDELEESIKEKTDNIRQDLYSSEKGLLEKITGLNQIIDSNQKQGGSKQASSIDPKEIAKLFSGKLLELKTENKKNVLGIQKAIEGNAKEIEDIKSKINQSDDSKGNYDALDKKIMKQVSNFNELVKTNKKYFERIDSVKKQFEDYSQSSNNAIEQLKRHFKDSNDDLSTKIEDVYKLIQDSGKNKDDIKESISSVKKDFSKLDEKTRKTFELLYKDVEEKIESSKKSINQQIEGLNKDIQKSKPEALNIDEKISSSINKLKAEFINDSKKKSEDDKKYQTEVKSLSASVGEVKNSLDASIKNVEQEILKLKEETTAFKLSEDKNQDLEELKKNYNQYVKKVDNAIEKLGKTLLTMQEKNKEGNKSLQVRIKNYIDSKNSSTINQMNNLINKLSLSFKEKEELRQEEMEQILSKKLKEIQKENERMIKRSIQELSTSKKESETYSIGRITNKSEYKTPVKKKKSIYDMLDSNSLLTQTASSNKKLGSTNDERSKILQFFYEDDDEDI